MKEKTKGERGSECVFERQTDRDRDLETGSHTGHYSG